LTGRLAEEAQRFHQIMLEHQSMVFSITRRILSDCSAGERAAEEVFLELHSKVLELHSKSVGLRSEEQVRFWLCRAAVRHSMDVLGQRSRRSDSEVDWDRLPRSPDLVSPPLSPVTLRLQQLVASLPPAPRTAVVLRFQEDLSPEEISGALEMPEATVKSNLQRSLRLLQKSMAYVAPGKERSAGYKLSLLPAKEERDEFEEALRIALARVPAPRELMLRVEWRLTALRPVAAAPGFHSLTVGAYSRSTSFWSVGAHAAVLALIVLALVFIRRPVHHVQETVTPIDIAPYLPIAPQPAQMGGGGGGGARAVLQAPKAKLPKVEQQPVAPPMIIRNDHPKLVATPAIKMPQNIRLAETNMPSLGDPRTSVVGPASNGTGVSGGIGTGSSGGIGSGGGIGYGPGQGAGSGGGIYHVGGGVSAPQVIYAQQPEFTDAARQAKYQGVCVVSLIVDAQGNPQRVQIIQHVGMGLDEKALEAVRHYKFKPAMLQGHPVPVEVHINVNFRLY